MKKYYGVVMAGIALLIFTGCSQTPPQQPPVACTADAKMCPDGSYVGRTGPNCEFTACRSQSDDYSALRVPSSTGEGQNDTMDQQTSSSISHTNTMQFDEQKQYSVILHTTAGDIEISLNKGQTPNTVKNFVTLAEKKFYDNTIFHRVIKGFMIQGGDPKGTGMGGPGYQFDDEPFTGEYTRGTVAMANAGPNTNGSQFFIMHADNPLPKNYTIFGHVTKGMEVVDTIANSPVTMSETREPSKPVTPIVVKNITVVEK